MNQEFQPVSVDRAWLFRDAAIQLVFGLIALPFVILLVLFESWDVVEALVKLVHRF